MLVLVISMFHKDPLISKIYAGDKVKSFHFGHLRGQKPNVDNSIWSTDKRFRSVIVRCSFHSDLIRTDIHCEVRLFTTTNIGIFSIHGEVTPMLTSHPGHLTNLSILCLS